MGSVGFVPVLAMLTMIVVLGLVWYNIQQTMDQLTKSRANRGAAGAGAQAAGSVMK